MVLNGLSGKIKRGSLNINKSLHNITTCDFTLEDVTGDVDIFDTFSITDTLSNEIFAGKITKYVHYDLSEAGYYVYEINAQADEVIPSQRLIQQFYTSTNAADPSTTIIDNCGDIVNDICSMIGVTSGTVFDGFDVSNIYFDDLYADRCLSMLAAANNYVWYIDDGVLNFHPLEAKSYADISDESKLRTQKLKREHNFDNIVTRITFRNVVYLSEEIEEQATAILLDPDPEVVMTFAKWWQVKNPINNLIKITVNDVEQNFALDSETADTDYDTSYWFWQYGADYVRKHKSAIGTSTFSTVKFYYQTNEKNTIVVDAPTAQETAGIIDQVVENTITKTLSDTYTMGENLLAAHLTETINVEFASYDNFEIGQYRKISLPDYGDLNMMVIEKKITDTGRDDKTLLKEYRLSNNPNGGTSTNWWDLAVYDPYRDSEKPSPPVIFTTETGILFVDPIADADGGTPAPTVRSTMNGTIE